MPQQQSTSRTWYGATIADFLSESPDTVIGRITTHCDFTVLPTQRDAWLVQIDVLQEYLQGLHGSVFMEFSIRGMGRRIDAVLFIGAATGKDWKRFPLEKVPGTDEGGLTWRMLPQSLERLSVTSDQWSVVGWSVISADVGRR